MQDEGGGRCEMACRLAHEGGGILSQTDCRSDGYDDKNGAEDPAAVPR